MKFLIQHCLDHTAERFPDKTLFRFDEQAATYAEIVRRSNALAHFLRRLGVKKGDRVGIYLHKSMESAISIYGIHKAGAAYVPLDPAMSAERLQFLLQDCGIEFLITQDRLMRRLIGATAEVPTFKGAIGPLRTPQPEEGATFKTYTWDDVYTLLSDSPPDLPTLMEQDLAYIIYTSGSTGTPKGIMHTHHSGLTFAKYAAELYALQPSDIMSNYAPLHFDMSTFDLFSGPLCGATVVIIPEEYKMLPASLSELIQDEQLTVWFSVTTGVVELLLRGDLENRDLSSLRLLMFGGEPFPPIHLNNLMQHLPGVRFSNVYGPTELNQITDFDVPAWPHKYVDRYVPIGHVWKNGDYMIVDGEDNPVADGEQGELLIASPQRMVGYWNRPDLTEPGFFRQKPYRPGNYEKIFYRTGDLVHVDEDGYIQYLGRKDRQIKVRGFRVELDAIEVALTDFPAAASAAAYTLKPTGPEYGEEVGVIIGGAVMAKSGQTIDRQELQAHLLNTLPEYAVPRELAIRETFPRTGSGKIDRRKLQEMAQAELEETVSKPTS